MCKLLKTIETPFSPKRHRFAVVVALMTSFLISPGCSSSSDRALEQAKGEAKAARAEAEAAMAELARLKAKSQPSETASIPKGPWIEAVPGYSAVFGDGNGTGVWVFKYTGPWMDCWVEAEADGKWVVLQDIRGSLLKATYDGAKKALTELKMPTEEERRAPLLGYVGWSVQRKAPGSVTFDLHLTARTEVASSKESRTGKSLLTLANAGDHAGFRHRIAPVANLPTSLVQELTLLQGVVELNDGEKKVASKVRLKCKPWSPTNEVGQ